MVVGSGALAEITGKQRRPKPRPQGCRNSSAEQASSSRPWKSFSPRSTLTAMVRSQLPNWLSEMPASEAITAIALQHDLARPDLRTRSKFQPTLPLLSHHRLKSFISNPRGASRSAIRAALNFRFTFRKGGQGLLLIVENSSAVLFTAVITQPVRFRRAYVRGAGGLYAPSLRTQRTTIPSARKMPLRSRYEKAFME